jgi:phosphatidylinositol glycan class T
MRTSVFFSLCFCAVAVNGHLSDRAFEEYNEDLTLRDLPDGKLLAHFEFTTRVKANTKPNAPCKTIH